ncbi:hypothetical protein [Hyalangium gracile]|uniref:hypothetical protein n=1 Tax=Hyalangium gracile TaxID=394092 RepID=UPI001CCAEEF1|nr:hypothetical protein [Hyalangium gracile]
MRSWSLALLVTLASPALAQAPEPAAAPPAAPTAAPAEEKQAPPAPPAEAKPAPTPAPEAKAPAPAPAAPAPTPKAAPAAAAPVPKAMPPPPGSPPGSEPEVDEEADRRDRVKSTARFIFESLLNGDARRVAGEFLYPFQLEDKRYGTPEELVAAWVKQLRVKRTDLITLYDIEILSLPEMEKKYGKAPARLGYGNLKDPDIFVAVGNLSGHAAILLFRAPETAPARAFAYTD